MTGNACAGSRILGSLRSADGKGVVRMEDRFDTDIDDLWSALTDPRRFASGTENGSLPITARCSTTTRSPAYPNRPNLP
jgi:hypothetical protein